jgi:uncharacterized protein (UPF0548 family)
VTLFSLTAPSEAEIRRFISKQKDSGFSYPEVGASVTAAPAGYNVDHNRIQLGKGEDTWRRATEAIRAWRMFSLPWVSLHWPSAPILVGTDVAVSAHHLGFYSLNACRIVYVVDEDNIEKRFGFAYGTLAEHAESGEERFTVEWNREDESGTTFSRFLAPGRCSPDWGIYCRGYFKRDLPRAHAQALD